MFWIGLTTVVDGHAPQFGPFLPMWFIVLWLAEMSAYVVGRLATDHQVTATVPVTTAGLTAPVETAPPRPSVRAAAR
jgi:hypothetical protein